MLPPESWVSAGFALIMLVLDMTYSAFIVRPPPCSTALVHAFRTNQPVMLPVSWTEPGMPAWRQWRP